MSERIRHLQALLTRDCHVKLTVELHDASEEETLLPAETLTYQLELPTDMSREQRIERIKYALGQVQIGLVAIVPLDRKGR